MMGDALPAGEARFEASVTGGAPNVPRELLVLRDGDVIQTMPVTGPSFTHTFVASQPGEYRIQVQRGTVVDALSNPIGLGVVRREKPPVTERGDDAEQRIGLTVTPRRTRAGRRTRFVFHAYAGASREPVQR